MAMRRISVLLLALSLSTLSLGQAITFNAADYSGKGAPAAPADLNGDGILDIVAPGRNADNVNGFYVTLSNSDGGYQAPAFYTGKYGSTTAIAVGDFNGDGKVDVATAGPNNVYYIFLNRGDGVLLPSWNFATNQGSINCNIAAGDFNHDGKLDLVIQDCAHIRLQFLSGRGDGTFSGPSSIAASTDPIDSMFVGDYDGDGHADLATTWAHCDGGAGCHTDPQAVDLNGDGIKDLAVTETMPDGNSSVAVLQGRLNGTYKPDQIVYSPAGQLMAGRYDRDTKPDLLSWTSSDPNSPDANFEFLHNTSSGPFPTCAPTNAAQGIVVCSPKNGGALRSPVKFNIAAAFTSKLRKTEVWIDGIKRQESFNSYATYSFLKGSFNALPGAHRADVYTATYDNLLQHVTVNFTVK